MPLSKLDQNYRDMLNAAGGQYSKPSDRKESQRGRPSTANSHKKKPRGHSANHHHREDSYSKKDSSLVHQGSAAKKRQFENSIKSSKYSDSNQSQKPYNPPRKAKSQDRFAQQPPERIAYQSTYGSG